MTRGMIGVIFGIIFRIGQFEHDLDLQILRAIAPALGEIDQDFRQIDKDRGLHHRHLRLLLGRMDEEEL